jgi:aminoglycoside phosphotransferase family enzyme
MSSSNRCIVNALGGTNVMQYITISTTGNAQDFGDLLDTRSQSAAISDCHGGLD